MIRWLPDGWGESRTARSRRLRRVDVWDTDAPDCTCGHRADVHRHYRDGTDCSQCTCRSYTTRRTTP